MDRSQDWNDYREDLFDDNVTSLFEFPPTMGDSYLVVDMQENHLVHGFGLDFDANHNRAYLEALWNDVSIKTVSSRVSPIHHVRAYDVMSVNVDVMISSVIHKTLIV